MTTGAGSHHTADVVVVGAGGAGLPAAISARDHGASVVVVEANTDVGGHAILSGGNIRLGGGTSLQTRYGIRDSADQVYQDHTDPQNAHFMRSDRDLVRVFADENAPTFEFLLENGVVFEEGPPGRMSNFFEGSAARWIRVSRSSDDWRDTIAGRPGSGIVRPLESSARRKGVTFLLGHTLTRLVRQTEPPYRVVALEASTKGGRTKISARKGIVIATGGHSSNVAFRRVFDARLTEEYQTAGEPWTRQSGDGEMLALAIGAGLWGVGIQVSDAGRADGGSLTISKTRHVGCQWGYHALKWDPRSPVFSRARASGLTVGDFQDVILVNQVGMRFWNEADESSAFLNACLGPNGGACRNGTANGGGPIWAIFDARAVERERWICEPPHVDPDGWFFSADSIAELATKIVNPYQRHPIEPDTLVATVERYNLLVETGSDVDFGKPTPTRRVAAMARRIMTPPFYAAWATPILHDSLAGLRIDVRGRVLDWYGRAIPGLYCAGESAGGFGLHGLPRAIVFGRIAGNAAALDQDAGTTRPTAPAPVNFDSAGFGSVAPARPRSS